MVGSDPFLLGVGLFSWALAVSFREGKPHGIFSNSIGVPTSGILVWGRQHLVVMKGFWDFQLWIHPGSLTNIP